MTAQGLTGQGVTEQDPTGQGTTGGGARVLVIGGGAFGTALAVALSRRARVALWVRDRTVLASGASPRLPGVVLPQGIDLCESLPDNLAPDAPALVALPMQALPGWIAGPGQVLAGRPVVACAKGIDAVTGLGAAGLIARALPGATSALLTGPSFAADIARGLPTALTLACADEAAGRALQDALSTPVLRLYRTTDVVGAELGGALKNVIALAAGMVIGSGLGESARAALMTRGHAEMLRLALSLGGRAETLAGLSGLGDLVLTCTSEQSRNFCHGRALGAGQPPDPARTVEGVATAHAVAALARRIGIEMPIAGMVSAVLSGHVGISEAVQALLSRPLKEE
jgi:glycerol-3-phosphate dehydrogenase (NAD(P)+)